MPTKRTQKKPINKNDNKSIELVREAPPERKVSINDFLAPVLSQAQMNLILNKTPEHAIKKRQGPSGKSLSYVKHGYVTDQLNKLFGFDWDLVNEPMANGAMYALHIEEYPNPNPKAAKIVPIIRVRHVAVAGHIIARIHKNKEIFEISKSGFGSAIWNDNTEFGDALKSAQSDLLKSCAARIGIALDLYWDDMAEQEKYELSQQEKMKQATDEIVEGLVSDDDSSDIPADGVSLLIKAQSLFSLDAAAVKKILGNDFIKNYQNDMWERLVKSQEANDEQKEKGK